MTKIDAMTDAQYIAFARGVLKSAKAGCKVPVIPLFMLAVKADQRYFNDRKNLANKKMSKLFFDTLGTIIKRKEWSTIDSLFRYAKRMSSVYRYGRIGKHRYNAERWVQLKKMAHILISHHRPPPVAWRPGQNPMPSRLLDNVARMVVKDKPLVMKYVLALLRSGYVQATFNVIGKTVGTSWRPYGFDEQREALRFLERSADPSGAMILAVIAARIDWRMSQADKKNVLRGARLLIKRNEWRDLAYLIGYVKPVLPKLAQQIISLITRMRKNPPHSFWLQNR